MMRIKSILVIALGQALLGLPHFANAQAGVTQGGFTSPSSSASSGISIAGPGSGAVLQYDLRGGVIDRFECKYRLIQLRDADEAVSYLGTRGNNPALIGSYIMSEPVEGNLNQPSGIFCYRKSFPVIELADACAALDPLTGTDSSMADVAFEGMKSVVLYNSDGQRVCDWTVEFTTYKGNLSLGRGDAGIASPEGHVVHEH